MTKKLLIALLTLIAGVEADGKNAIYDAKVKTLQTVVNQDWLSPPVMRLGTNDVLKVSFDELSHTYHRYIYQLEHCEADWSPSESLFERLSVVLPKS